MQAPVRYPPAWPGASLGNCRPTRRASPGQTRMGRLPPRLAKGCQSTPKRARSIAARSSGPSLTFAVSINRISSSTSARSTGSFRLTSSGSRAGTGRKPASAGPSPFSEPRRTTRTGYVTGPRAFEAQSVPRERGRRGDGTKSARALRPDAPQPCSRRGTTDQGRRSRSRSNATLQTCQGDHARIGIAARLLRRQMNDRVRGRRSPAWG